MANQLNEREIFFQAIEIEDPVDRVAFVEQRCKGNPELSAQVCRLLAEHMGETDLLIDRQLFATGDVAARSTSLAEGAVLGSYTLEQLLGEGGMGEVWVAAQRDPIRRRVAVKLIRSGRETPGVIQRFEVERQALAAMDHPNIARVLDAGTTVNHRPYFVMELVNGASLLQFCDEAKLDVRKRLEVFLQAARAVQHAHQKAIIHRDLKPSNILVTMIDGQPVPKIIDFGLAKALSGNLTDDTVNTQFGAVMGTLQYMAPEQAGYSGQDVDTRADVYSLGVILYELLTGLQPFGKEHFENATVEEKFKIVREQEPPTPSSRLSSSGSAPANAILRQTDTNQLASLLRNELDWVVMKALDKDRDRRYQSASELADDVSRYLAGEPVEAHPPSRAYRVRKYIRKNKGLVVSFAAITSVLLLGIAGTTYGLMQSNASAKRLGKEVKRASDAEQVAVEQKNAALEARSREQRQRKYADAIAEFLSEDFLELTSWQGRQGLLQDQLASTSANETLGSDATLAELLDRAAGRLAERDDLDDRVSAQLYHIIGQSFSARNEYERAIPLLERAIELNKKGAQTSDDSYIETKNALANALYHSGRTDRAVELFDELVELYSRTKGPAHRDTVSARLQLAVHALQLRDYAKANKLFESGLQQMREFDETDSSIPMYMSFLAQSLSESGELSRAVSLAEEALVMAQQQWRDDHPETLQIFVKLARMYLGQGRYQKCIDLTDKVLELLKPEADYDYSIRRVVWMTRLDALRGAGRPDEAADAQKNLIEILENRLQREVENSIQLADAYFLGVVYGNAGDLERGLEMFQRAFELCQNESEGDRPLKAVILNGMGMLNFKLENFNEAVAQLEQAAELSRTDTGDESPQTLHCLSALALAYRKTGKLSESLEIVERVLEIQRKQLGDEHPSVLSNMTNIAVTSFDLGRTEASIEMFRKAIDIRERVQSSSHPEVLSAMNSLAAILQHTGELEESVALYQKSWNLRKASSGENDSETRLTRSLLLGASAALAAKNEDLQGAIEKQRESLNVQRQNNENHWLVYLAQSKLGEYLTQHQHEEEAAELLVQAFHGLQKHQKSLPLQHAEQPRAVAKLLAELAESRGDESEQEKWLEEVSKLSTEVD